MYPILFSICRLGFSSFSLFLILAWVLWSFLFWRHLRDSGGDEPRIFDNMFFITVWAFIGARAAYVFFHFPLFSSNILRVAAIWIQPGLSLYGALIAAIAACAVVSYGQKGNKIKFSTILDALALSVPWAITVGLIGGLLDGGTAGTATHLPWAVMYVGHIGRRHPVQLYLMIGMLIVGAASGFFRKAVSKRGLPPGSTAAMTAALYSVIAFVLEFFADVPVYWNTVRANQLVLVVLFGQAVGALAVYGGGKQLAVRFLQSVRMRITKVKGGIYAKFSKRNSGTDTTSS